jgi:hypothetical protein
VNITWQAIAALYPSPPRPDPVIAHPPRHYAPHLVIASEARQSMTPDYLDCHVVFAPRNDDQRGNPWPQSAWIATPLPRLAMTALFHSAKIASPASSLRLPRRFAPRNDDQRGDLYGQD